MDSLLFASIVRRDFIDKGWSADKKYCAHRSDGTKLLLRVIPSEKYERTMHLFQLLRHLEDMGLPISLPLEVGICPEGAYLIQTWIEGCNAEETIPSLGTEEQCRLGREAGIILRKIHEIPAPVEQEEWEPRMRRKTETKIRAYLQCGFRFAGDEHFLGYVEANRDLLAGRPQCFQHGDYHIGNMMLENGAIRIIDFDRFDYGDPWEEFNRIVWCAQKAPHFASGMVEGYWNGPPPEAFWQLLAFYIACNTLAAIPWAIPFGHREIDVMRNLAQNVLTWYDNMQNTRPSWYSGRR